MMIALVYYELSKNSLVLTAGWLSNAIIISTYRRVPAASGTTSSLYTQCEPHVANEPADGANDAAEPCKPTYGADQPSHGNADGSNESHGTYDADVANESYGPSASNTASPTDSTNEPNGPTGDVRLACAAGRGTPHGKATQKSSAVPKPTNGKCSLSPSHTRSHTKPLHEYQ